MSLEETFDDALAIANFLIDHIRAATSVKTIGEPCVELSSYYRALGICELLIECDVDAFFHFLIHGALTRKYYLARCAREGMLDEPERRASLLDPFFDAVAANQLGLAGEIAALSASSRVEDFEDDIDFACARAAHALLSPVGSPDLRAAIDGYEAALGGDGDERLAVYRAIDGRDERAFAEAFPALIEAHDERMAKLESSIRSNESTYLPNSHVFIEGLALLRIAERAGMRTEREYPRCPGPARLSTYRPFAPASFPNMGLQGQ